MTLIACESKKDSDLLFPLIGGSTVNSTVIQEKELSLKTENVMALGISASQSLTKDTETEASTPVVITNDLELEEAFLEGNESIKVKKFYTSPNSDVITVLKERILLKEENGKTLFFPGFYKREFKPCLILLTRDKSTTCMDYGMEYLNSEIKFDSEGNYYYVYDNTLIKRNGKNTTTILSGTIMVGNFNPLSSTEILVEYNNTLTNTFYFVHMKNGVSKVIVTINSGSSLQFSSMFPDNNFYYAHNFGGANGTGLFQYNPVTEVKTAISSNQANWENYSTSIKTNFTSSGNGYLVKNSGKVFYQAMTQVAVGDPYAGRRFVYQLYPIIKIIPVDNLHKVSAIYSIPSSDEVLVAGSLEGSTDIEFRILKTSDYSVRNANIGSFPILPSVSVSETNKTVTVVDGVKLHTFDFTTGTASYSLTTLSSVVTEITNL